MLRLSYHPEQVFEGQVKWILGHFWSGLVNFRSGQFNLIGRLNKCPKMLTLCPLNTCYTAHAPYAKYKDKLQ